MSAKIVKNELVSNKRLKHMDTYSYLNVEIAKVENIKKIVNNRINNSYVFSEEFESLENYKTESMVEYKNELIDLALDIRTQMNLLSLAIDDLKKFNRDMVLNSSNLPNEHIRPLSDIAFKIELLSHMID